MTPVGTKFRADVVSRICQENAGGARVRCERRMKRARGGEFATPASVASTAEAAKTGRFADVGMAGEWFCSRQNGQCSVAGRSFGVCGEPSSSATSFGPVTLQISAHVMPVAEARKCEIAGAVAPKNATHSISRAILR